MQFIPALGRFSERVTVVGYSACNAEPTRESQREGHFCAWMRASPSVLEHKLWWGDGFSCT